MHFGKRLLLLRRHFGFTQEQMGKHLGISHTAYAKKEKKAELPKQHELAVYARLFGLSEAQLTGNNELIPYLNDKGKPAVKINVAQQKLDLLEEMVIVFKKAGED